MRRRFRLTLPVAVSWAVDRQRRIATGLVVEIGSDALIIAGADTPPPGAVVTASVEWPVCLEDGCRLRLIVIGRPRSAPKGYVELAVERYEYRTASRADAFFTPHRRDEVAPVIPIPVAS